MSGLIKQESGKLRDAEAESLMVAQQEATQALKTFREDLYDLAHDPSLESDSPALTERAEMVQVMQNNWRLPATRIDDTIRQVRSDVLFYVSRGYPADSANKVAAEIVSKLSIRFEDCANEMVNWLHAHNYEANPNIKDAAQRLNGSFQTVQKKIFETLHRQVRSTYQTQIAITALLHDKDATGNLTAALSHVDEAFAKKEIRNFNDYASFDEPDGFLAPAGTREESIKRIISSGGKPGLNLKK